MNSVEKYLSELLYEHDCVIVPDFGGFVANYHSAKVHPVQHTFTAPFKKIVFNKNLKTNDGLLANSLVQSENIGYPIAIKRINDFVEEVNTNLKKGTKVKIGEVGNLFVDVEKNIQFEQSTTNFLLDSFGLNSFQSPAIKRDGIGKRIEKEFKDRNIIPQEKKKINVKRIVAFSLLVPFFASLVWVSLKTDLHKISNYSNLNPFATTKESKIKTDYNITPNVKTVVNNSDTLQQKITQPKVVIPAAITEVEPVKADTTAVTIPKVNNLDFQFHLVAGCFQIENNAVNFVASLKEQNISAEIIGKNSKGLFVVSCGDFQTKTEAKTELVNLRKQQPNAWLYRN